jgi:hypothetical protein
MSKEKKLQIRNSTAEFLIFTRQAGEDGIEVRVAEETVWLTQKLISVLFDKGRSTITEHLKNIFETKELDEKAVCRDFRHTAEDGKAYTTRFYNLDAIPDCKGMRYVAYLLTHPAECPLHAIDLVGMATMTAAPTTTAETTDPDTGQPIQVQIGARTQDRSHSLDDAVVAQRIRAKEQEWEAVLDDPDVTEPEKAEAQRFLVELHAYQKTHSNRSRSSADKLVRAVRANITRLQAQLAKATDEHRKPHPVLRAFAEHIAKYIITPSARYSAHVRSTARTGLAGRFTYEPPAGVGWSE